MGSAIKHPVPDRVKPPFVIFDIRALWRSAGHSDAQGWASECPVRVSKITNDRLNPVWRRMLYSCTRMATVGVKGLSYKTFPGRCDISQSSEWSEPQLTCHAWDSVDRLDWFWRCAVWLIPAWRLKSSIQCRTEVNTRAMTNGARFRECSYCHNDEQWC